MMGIKTIYDYPRLAAKWALGKKLGCVMLNTTSPATVKNAGGYELLRSTEYHDPQSPYVNGLANDYHVTVRYGFLPELMERRDVETVAQQFYVGNLVTGKKLEIAGITLFRNNADYDVVVMKLEPPKWLRDFHTALGVLPNIETFPEYNPHVTLGYFQKGAWDDHQLAMEYTFRSEVTVRDLKISGKYADEDPI